MHKLFILEINPLSVASFANILSHSVSWLLVLIMVSFSVLNLLSTPHFHFAGSRVISIVKHLSTFLLPTLSALWDNRGWKDGKEMNGCVCFSKEESWLQVKGITACTKIRGCLSCFDKGNSRGIILDHSLA